MFGEGASFTGDGLDHGGESFSLFSAVVCGSRIMWPVSLLNTDGWFGKTKQRSVNYWSVGEMKVLCRRKRQICSDEKCFMYYIVYEPKKIDLFLL